MKGRFFIFFLGLLLGGVLGYFAGQEEFRIKAKAALDDAALRVGSQVDRLILRMKGEAAAPDAQTTNAAASPPRQDTLQDKLAYLRESVRVADLKANAPADTSGPTSLTGKIMNSGDRKLGKAEVIIYFMGNDTIVQEHSFEAVGENPMEPGEERVFEMELPKIHEAWIPGRLRASVTDIQFAP